MDMHEPLNLIRTGAIEPWEQLNRTLAEQRAVETANSDEALDAGRLAVEIIRLAAGFDLDSRDLCRRSQDWAMVSAVADASGKRLLSSAARRTTLIAESHFEADGKGNYRFLNNSLVIVDPTGGKADFLTAAARAIEFLIKELGLEIDWTPEILEGPPVFTTAVTLDAGPDPKRVFESLQVQFHKRDPNGDMATFNPQNWQLELKTTGK
jgi:hypothetical protein